MRIIFFGTGKFAIPSLKRLMNSRHEVLAVVTLPDAKSGRGMNPRPTPVKAFIEQAAPAIPVFQPGKVNDKKFTDPLRLLEADVFVVIDYGSKLSKELLGLPAKYCVNLHPSLLPKYRGASPVNWAILSGDKETGNTVIKMAEQMDAGDIITQKATAIGDDEDAVSLEERLSQAGAELLADTLEAIEKGEERPVKQDESKASYAPRLQKKQGRIDWSEDAAIIERKVRGMKPWPGTFTYLNKKLLKIHGARITDTGSNAGKPGTFEDTAGFIVRTGKGALQITRLQPEGKRVMTAEEFLRGTTPGPDAALE